MQKVSEMEIPDILKSFPLEWLDVQPGAGDDYYVTMESVRIAMENHLQDNMLNHIVTVRDDMFIISPASDD